MVECAKCGLCCRTAVLYQYKEPSAAVLKLYSWRGISVQKIEFSTYAIIIPTNPCKYLDTETNLCTKYWHKPKICSDYPDYHLKLDGCAFQKHKS